MSGDVVLSTQTADGKVPFRLTPPEDLADRVGITPYSEDGNVGARVSFTDLSFEELEKLSSALSPSDSRYKLTIKRTGSLVIFEAMVDLTPLASTDSSLFVELSAPGEVTSTNGEQGAGTVSWQPEAGEVTNLNATYQYSGARNHEWLNWSLILGGVGFITTVSVGGFALVTHHRARRAAGVRGY